MKYIGVIPARAGSRRLPGKNMRLLAGKPLLQHSIDAALAAKHLDLVVVSTDIPEALALAASYNSPRLVGLARPETLAGDLVTTEAVLLAVLAQLGEPAVEGVVTLLPTSPFRTGALIDQCIERYQQSGADAVLTVQRMKLKLGRLDPETGEFSLLDPETPAEMHRVQPSIADNPAVYVTRPDVLRDGGFVLGKRNVAVEIDRVTALDINDAVDFKVAEAVIAELSQEGTPS